MHDHGETLALAAAAIDFELDPAERARLDAALEACSLCRRQASAMRATATILRRPSDIGTPGRVRDVVLGAALRGNRRAARFGPQLVASLTLLAVLGGTALVVGNRGFGILPPVMSSSPVPELTMSAVATPTPTPTREPVPTPTPTVTAPTASPLPPVDGPLQAGDIAAMVTDGRLVIRTLPQATVDSAIFKTRLYPGQRVLVLEGPVEGTGYPWFRIRVGAIEGWVAAASRDGEPWLAPVSNGLIAFVREATDGSSESIYTVGPDGTTGEEVLFADARLSHYEQLVWSPDGRRLAFVGVPAIPAIDPPGDIFVIDADGSNLVQVTQNDLFEDSPAWSPDSTGLAFRQAKPNPVTDPTVVVTNADGSGLLVLGPGENPVWAPDGQQLAMTVPDGSSSRLWVQAADGGDRRQVADVSVPSARAGWSPDGQFLVISSSGLSVIEISTGSITSLTEEPGSTPAWSIGGTIAFSTTGSASSGVFVVDVDGSGPTRLADDMGFASVRQWSPDSRSLLLGDEATGSPNAVVRLDGSGLAFVGARTYVVASGDTFARIAATHELTQDRLLAANPQVTNPDQITIGDVLAIPMPGGSVRSPAWQPLFR